MGVLSNGDFTPGKTASTGPYAGKTRSEIVQLKIKDNKDFYLGAKGTSGAVKGVSYDPKTKAFSYQTKTGKKTTVNCNTITGSKCNIFKDSDFGGGGGSGGGSDQTAYAESAQCVWIIACLKHANKPFSFFKESHLKAAYNDQKCNVGSTTFEQIMSLPAAWQQSGYLSAMALIKNGHVNNTHEFHRDSSVMKKIYKQRGMAFKNSGIAELKEDKWNPGDIWAVKKGFDVSKLDISTIKAYNKELAREFANKNIVGISLKLIKRNVKISVLNDTDERPNDLSYAEGQLSSSRGTFFSNKSGTIIYNGQGGGKMEIRTNAALSTHKVEIMLKTARGGGAGWGVIQDIVSEVNSHSLPSNSAMTLMAGNIVAGKTNDINNFWNMAKVCGIEKEMTKKQFTQELKAVDKIWLHSKLGALELIHQLETAPKKKADLIINKIFNYAGSQSDLSSVYVKVYE